MIIEFTFKIKQSWCKQITLVVHCWLQRLKAGSQLDRVINIFLQPRRMLTSETFVSMLFLFLINIEKLTISVNKIRCCVYTELVVSYSQCVILCLFT